MIKIIAARITSLAFFTTLFFQASISYGLELRFWEHEKPQIQSVLDDLIKEFTKANPKIKIKRSHYKTEDLRTQYQTAAMGGGGADLVLAPNDFAGPFSIMGIISDVNEWGKLDRFDPTVVSAVTDSQKKTWGIPVSKGNHLMLFVNKKMVKKAPETVEELVIAAKKHSNAKKNVFGFAYNLNEPFWFVSFMGAFGEKPLVDGKPVLSSKGMMDALALAKKFKFEDKIVPPDCDYACADTLFVEGKVAMTINGDWSIQKYSDALKKDLIIAPLPRLKKTGKYMKPMVSGKYLFFNSRLKGKKLEAAQKFSDFIVSVKTQQVLANKTRRLPSLKGKAAEDIVKNDFLLSQSNLAMKHGAPMPMAVEMRVVWDAIRPQLQNVMAGKGDLKKVVSIMQSDAVTKIKEMKE